MVELGHVQKLVELMSSIHFVNIVCCSRFRLQLLAICCNRRGGVDSTPHTSLFSHAVDTQSLLHITLHGTSVGAYFTSSA